MHLILAVIAPLVLAMLPALVAAQEVIGEISATLGEERRSWQTLSDSSGSENYNTYLREHNGILEISLHGHGRNGGPEPDLLVIDLSLLEGSVVPISQAVLYVAESMTTPWASLNDEDVVTITRFDPEGEVEGELAGRLCYKDGLMAQPDRGNCMDIVGHFVSRLPLAE